MVELVMARRVGAEPAPLSAPGGYSLRWHRPGDRLLWMNIQASTGIYGPLPPDLFDREFGNAPELLPQRQCFVVDADGLGVGTATAWLPGAGRGASEGRLHWLAVSPGHQRRGLGRYLAETACARLRDLGATCAYLTTGAENLAAVQLYLGLGFQPQVMGSQDRAAWRILGARLEPRFGPLLFRSQRPPPA
jgi:GNAT superfamily N-acetyltransferase